MRSIELLLGIGTALAALVAILATIYAPIATTGLSVEGAAPVTHAIYARDHGLVPMLAVMIFIAALAICVLVGAYSHAYRGSTLGRAIMWAATLAYVLLAFWSLQQGAFAAYPALVAVACAAVALVPSRRRAEPGVQATHG